MIYYQTENGMLHQGDVLDVLRTLPSESVHMVVTSPPYWGLRDYHHKDQIGLEKTPEEYVSKLVEIFREIRRVLRNDGTLWLNLGDSYYGSWANYSGGKRGAGKQRLRIKGSQAQNPVWEGLEGYRPAASFPHPSLKSKDLVGIPWRVAFALQGDGWYLRQDIIWHKPNPMPESVIDRCTKAHEYIFLLTKSVRYFYDNIAIMEPIAESSIARLSQPNLQNQIGSDRVPGKTNGNMKAVGRIPRKNDGQNTGGNGSAIKDHVGNSLNRADGQRNLRDVWTIITQSFSKAHFATFPEKLPHTCILAGTSQKGCCPSCGRPWERIVEKRGGTIGKGWTDHKADLEKGMAQINHMRLGTQIDVNGEKYHITTIGWRPGPGCKCHLESTEPCVVLDPFGGAGTSGLVAEKLGRKWILIELSEAYCEITKKRIEPYTKQFKMKFA